MKSEPFALITGATSGLGQAYALELARHSRLNLMLVARRADRLEEVAAQARALRQDLETVLVPCDLADPTARRGLLPRLVDPAIPIELLINCAGSGFYGPVAAMESDSLRKMLELNCLAPLELCQALLPAMRARRSGRILNVCSRDAFLPIPHLALYAATKAFLFSFSVALGAEEKRHGVRIVAVCPGATRTDFQLASQQPARIQLFPKLTVEKVVRESLAARRAVTVHGWWNRVLIRIALVCGPWAFAGLLERWLRPSDRAACSLRASLLGRGHVGS